MKPGRSPVVKLLAFPADGQPATAPVFINIERIRKLTPLDTTFTRRDVRLEDVIG
jgi:hypothetical protein